MRTRDILAGPPLTLAWDAGSRARFLVHADLESAEATWDDSPLPVTVERPKSRLTRLSVSLPATVAAGRLELVVDGYAHGFAAELWPPRQALLDGFDARPPIAPPEADSPEARARATAGWKAAFRAAHQVSRAAGLRAAEAAQRTAAAAGHIGESVEYLGIAYYLEQYSDESESSERFLLAAEASSAAFSTVFLDGVISNYRAMLHLTRGRPASAEALFREATGRAHDAGLKGMVASLAAPWLLSLARLGRFDDGYDVIQSLTPRTETSTRARADFAANAAEFHFRRWASGREASLDDALRSAAEAEALLEAAGDPVSARARRFERAWWNARAGRIEAAVHHLAAIGPGPEPGEVAGLETLARARVALARGHTSSVSAILGPLVEHPPDAWAAFEGEVEIEGRIILAEAKAAEGDFEAELDALEGALDAAHRRVARLGLAAGPADLLGRRAPLSRRAVQRLVQAGELERAFALDDRHRSLILRALGQRLAEAPPALSVSAAAPLRRQLARVAQEGCLPPTRNLDCAARASAILAEIEAATRRRSEAEAPTSLDATTPARIRAALRDGEQIWVDTATRGAFAGFVMTDDDLRYGPFPETPPPRGARLPRQQPT